MEIKKYDGFVDKVYADNTNLVEAMKMEIKDLLVEFGEAYDLEANQDEQLENCSESIMNLIFETEYEW